MKKSLTILTILAIMLVAMTSSVFAATATVDPASTQKITAGQQVKVTVNSGEGRGVSYDFAYDASKFTYDEATEKNDTTIQSVNSEKAGELTVVALSTTQTLIFTAKEDIEIPAGGEALTFAFKATNIHVSGTTERPEATATLTVNPAGSPTPTDPTKDPAEEEQIESETLVDKNGNPINGLPNAGTPIFVGAIALIVVAGAVLVIKNRK